MILNFVYHYGFLYPLFLIFVVAKLFGAIDWSWWWICAPLIVQISIEVSWIVWAIIDFFQQRDKERDGGV